ncbi:MAG: hypothetical protein KatS3mg115_2299 [Candidatus Poribacteria bacterium]|nr:MAG: hypothetical protein KatS3mg115_2299 [Candidatus Poribacteria bacterium]
MAWLLSLLWALSAEETPQLTHLKTIPERIAARDFPSIFQAWNPADNLPSEDRWETMARHDLVWLGTGALGLRWNHHYAGLAKGFVPEDLSSALERRRLLLEKNPCLILIAEIRYRDAGDWYLPPDHPWWQRDESGQRIVGWEEGNYYLLDFSNPAFQAQVAQQAAAAVRSGVFDGVLLDWWRDDPERLSLLRRVREAVGPDALILVNSNDRTVPKSAPYVNGLFMECYRSQTPEDWRRIEATLRWAESALRAPRANCLETWYHRSRRDEHLMRATTTLVLTHSDGYALFSDPNPLPTPDHLHDWYPFWDAPLGRPTAPGVRREDGSWTREFTGGTALYNPMGNPPTAIRFSTPRWSVAQGRSGTTFTVPGGDGDLFLQRTEANLNRKQ